MIEKGFYWHVHHDNLLEWCYGYQERVDYIKEKKPKSIYELAKMLDRNWRLVAKDVELLSNLGIVKLEKREKPKEVIRPIVNFNKMDINVTI